MAMNNSREPSYRPFQEFSKSKNVSNADNFSNDYSNGSDFSESQFNEYIRIVDIVKIMICILGLIANVLSIIATVNVPREKWSTYNKLIINLAVSDILVVCSVFVYVILTFTAVHHPCADVFHQMLLNIALTSTLFNLVLMAIDHYFAIIYALYYGRVFSNIRVNYVIVCLWIVIFFCGVIDIFVAFGSYNKKKGDFCTYVNMDNFNYELVIIIVIFAVLLGLLLIYSRICYRVRTIVRQDEFGRRQGSNSIKAVVTTFLIIGTFALCWCPLGIYHFIYYIWPPKMDLNYESINTFLLVNNILLCVLLLNPLCDPIIYALRRSEVKLGYIRFYNRVILNRRTATFDRSTYARFVRRSGSHNSLNAETSAVVRLSFSRNTCHEVDSKDGSLTPINASS
ncbi:melanocortin receptor 4-like [Mya arenaria]|uniref:melanocortin receptor 4-like n=1 Tax=Mya arenaria TaxID=6604 RepID=UPI0022E31D9D|nr:melanocortin receptor 4-like [Mya arenaria]XP_052762916.1 melanocortin receptor 4-like [Mya arenaria]